MFSGSNRTSGSRNACVCLAQAQFAPQPRSTAAPMTNSISGGEEKFFKFYQHSRNVLNSRNKHHRRSECPAPVIRLTSQRPPCPSPGRPYSSPSPHRRVWDPKSSCSLPSFMCNACVSSTPISHPRVRPPSSWRRPLPSHSSDARVSCPTLTFACATASFLPR